MGRDITRGITHMREVDCCARHPREVTARCKPFARQRRCYTKNAGFIMYCVIPGSPTAAYWNDLIIVYGALGSIPRWHMQRDTHLFVSLSFHSLWSSGHPLPERPKPAWNPEPWMLGTYASCSRMSTNVDDFSLCVHLCRLWSAAIHSYHQSGGFKHMTQAD